MKVAIPRVQKRGQTPTLARVRRHAPQACNECRRLKIRCSANSPRCERCERTDSECVYNMSHAERLENLTTRCVQMAALLNELKGRANDEENTRITELLNAVEDDIPGVRQTPNSADKRNSRDTYTHLDTTAFALDTEALDLLDEDVLKNERTRATGFMGKSSEVQWLRSIVHQLECYDDDAVNKTVWGMNEGLGGVEQVSFFTFFLDSDEVDLEFNVDSYELPPFDIAERLLGCYMHTVHNSFPILSRKPFEDQVRLCFRAKQIGDAIPLDPRWQAVCNLVFAIGAKYSHLIKASWCANAGDHRIYQARAKALGMDKLAVRSYPDVLQIQLTGLLAFYCLSVGEVSRAWIVLGKALRFAHALGLHMRNEEPSTSFAKRELLVRIWWSLYTLERLLSVITGRPSVIVDSYCSVPLPTPLVDEQLDDLDTPMSSFDIDRPLMPTTVEANVGSFFQAVVQNSIISQDILSSIYSVNTMIRTPGEIQQDISCLEQRLDQWATSLPPEFQVQSQTIRTNLSRHCFRERTLLGLYLNSARILLTRPYLGAIRQSNGDRNVALTFSRRMAGICIDAAKVVTDVLPDKPDPLYIYEWGPWWSIVHYLMQALSVFLLGLIYMSRLSEDSVVLLQHVKKLLRWLRAMQDPLAGRAYRVALSTLQTVAQKLALDISDLLFEDAMCLGTSGTNSDDRG